MRRILLLVVASFSLATCGGGGGTTGTGGTTGGGGTTGSAGAGTAGTGGTTGAGGTGGGSPGLCQQVGSALCEKACSCREGPECAISDGGITFSVDNDADCRALFVTFGCSMGDAAAYNDAAACLPLIQAATCMGTGTEGAVSYPTATACQSPPQPGQ
jgi:hypothetical protein